MGNSRGPVRDDTGKHTHKWSQKKPVLEPHADGLSTYGDKGARLDWILVSTELEFRTYAVYPDVVSDHYAVAADIVLGPQP